MVFTGFSSRVFDLVPQVPARSPPAEPSWEELFDPEPTSPADIHVPNPHVYEITSGAAFSGTCFYMGCTLEFEAFSGTPYRIAVEGPFEQARRAMDAGETQHLAKRQRVDDAGAPGIGLGPIREPSRCEQLFE